MATVISTLTRKNKRLLFVHLSGFYNDCILNYLNNFLLSMRPFLNYQVSISNSPKSKSKTILIRDQSFRASERVCNTCRLHFYLYYLHSCHNNPQCGRLDKKHCRKTLSQQECCEGVNCLQPCFTQDILWVAFSTWYTTSGFVGDICASLSENSPNVKT